MKTFSISGGVTLNFSFSIRAKNEDEAYEKAVQYLYDNYQTLSPDGCDASITDVIED